MTPEDLELAATYLRKYAAAVESKLYINMKIPQAHDEIAVAERLAGQLEAAARKDKKDNGNLFDIFDPESK